MLNVVLDLDSEMDVWVGPYRTIYRMHLPNEYYTEIILLHDI